MPIIGTSQRRAHPVTVIYEMTANGAPACPFAPCGILIGITVRRRCAPPIALGCSWSGGLSSDHNVLYEPGGGLTDTLQHRKCGGSVKQERIDKKLNQFPVVLNVSALVLTGITIYPGIDDSYSRR